MLQENVQQQIKNIEHSVDVLTTLIPVTRRPRSGAQSGSHIYQFGGGGGSWNFDAEFKCAKIQNSLVEGGGGAHGNLMLSSNLLIV